MKESSSNASTIVAANIRSAMDAAHLTADQLADATGVGTADLAGAGRDLTMDDLHRVALALGTSGDVLLAGVSA